MNSKHILGLVFILQLTAVDVLALHEYFYEFGNKEFGAPIFSKEGKISVLSYINDINIPVGQGEEITYVSVKVHAMNPPKVDYDNETKTISIKYSLLEITYSTYNIFVKGIKRKE